MREPKRPRIKVRHLVVPVALAVTIVTAALSVTSNLGCGDGPAPTDAGLGDGGPDTPII